MNKDMDQIEINNSFEKQIPSDFIKGAAEKTLDYLREKEMLENDFELSIALIEEKEIAKLNKQYRERDEETDVLSFCYEKNDKKIVGELLLCLGVIEKNSKNDRIETEIELEKNIIHGILHIIGLEHGDEMFFIQDEILGK